MSMSSDITNILEEWPFDPEQTVRIVVAADGRSVLQTRLPLGIEQYEIDGRPDGREGVLEEIKGRLREYIRENSSDEGFTISHEDFLRLQGEGILFYYRYLLLFQINDYEKVVRDTAHNLEIASLVEKYVESPEDRIALLQYKPYILRMNSISRSMLSVRLKEPHLARNILREAITQIKSLEDIDSPAFQFEKIRSINYLKSALKQFEDREGDDNPGEELKRELELAIQEENYERAAELRDRLRGIGG